eukprot:2771974-Pyramimonas_sp.AAC.1
MCSLPEEEPSCSSFWPLWACRGLLWGSFGGPYCAGGGGGRVPPASVPLAKVARGQVTTKAPPSDFAAMAPAPAG